METFEQTGKSLMDLITNTNVEESIDGILSKTQDINLGYDKQEEVEKASLIEVYGAINECMAGLGSNLGEFFGNESIPVPSISALQYYFEKMDEVKNPSWKRRIHRFFPNIDVAEMEILNQKLQLARLAYASSVDEVKDALSKYFDSELLFCDLEAKPNKPAHFLAIKKDQSKWSDSVDVFLVVCGTKTVVDVVTDLVCEAQPYRSGYAHAGIAESGQYIAEKHIDFLQTLLKESGKRKINMQMVGHSLGAGTASIAAIEWNEYDFIDVEMTGFGCPALLSEELADEAKEFITTVVSDNDCVPRYVEQCVPARCIS